MDIPAGLAAAAQAVRIAQSLRRAGMTDATTCNAQISDLLEKLSDIRLALIDARARQVEAEAELIRLSAACEDQGRLDARAAGETTAPRAQAARSRAGSAARARRRAPNLISRAEL